MYSNSRRMTFARALYDNCAEMPRELSFKKGDILTVLQETYEDYPDWWVCSLRNKVGLAPANRLEAMPVLIESKSSHPTLYTTQMSQSLYDELPDRSNISSAYFNSSPTDERTYYNTSRSSTIINDSSDLYSTYQVPIDTPPTPMNQTDPVDKNQYKDASDIYQTPDTNNDIYQVPASSYFHLKDGDYSTLPETNEMCNDINSNSQYHTNRVDYTDSFLDTSINQQNKQFPSSSCSSSLTSLAATRSNSASISGGSSESSELRSMPPPPARNVTLNISPEQASSKFQQLHNEVTNSCNGVIEFVKPKWQSLDNLSYNIKLMEGAFRDMYRDLVNLVEFAHSILDNSTFCGDKELSRRIWKSLSHLQDSRENIFKCLDELGSSQINWQPKRIFESIRLSPVEGRDCLSRLVSSARNILIYSRSLSVVVNGNASILFDYSANVCRRDTLTKQTGEAERTNTNNNFNSNNNNNNVSNLIENSNNNEHVKEILKLFLQQLKMQNELTKQTVDDFLILLTKKSTNLQNNESLMTNSKFVLRTGTQLVCVAKNLTDAQIRLLPNNEIELAGNRLCDSLKQIVMIVKNGVNSDTNLQNLTDCLKNVKAQCDNLQNVVVQSVSQIP